MARPVFQSNGPVTISLGIDVDFNNASLTTPVSSYASGALWGSGVWGLSTWGSGLTLQQNWISVGALGYAMAPHMIVSGSTLELRLMNLSLLYERGLFL